MTNMTLTDLKVKNKLYNLGLTEEDFKILKEAKEKERNESVARDVTTYVLRKGRFAYGVSYGYDYQKGTYSIYIVTASADEVKKVPTTKMGRYELNFETTAKEREHLSKLLPNFANDLEEFGSVEEMKKAVKEGVIRTLNETKESSWRRNLSIGTGVVKGLHWLFGKEIGEEEKNALKKADTYTDEDEVCENDNDEEDDILDEDDDEEKDYSENLRDLMKILLVFEHDNNRISLYRDCVKTEFKYYLNIFSIDSPEYNYIDKGRFFYKKKYFWNDLTIKDLNPQFFSKLARPDEFSLIDKEEYDRTARKYRLKVEKETEEQELKNVVKKKASEGLENLKKKPITINGMTFSKNGVIYQNQEIRGEFSELKGEYDYYRNKVNDMLQFLERNVDVHRLNELDFNSLFNTFCDEMKGREFKGVLGKLRVRVERKETKGEAYQYFVNKVRINKDEIPAMLKRAICFDNHEDYKKLLEKVSKCNLKFHDIISNGLRVEFRDDAFHSGGMLTKFNIVRKKNKNYITLAGNEYKITNTNKLIALSVGERSRNADYISLEKLTATLKDIVKVSDEVIVSLLQEGLKDYEKAVKRSEEFLKQAIETLKVGEAEKGGHSGYLITGTSGRKYLLTKGLKVFDYATMNYICIVDKSLGKGFQNDKIVNRMYALANDSYTAKDIYTLNGNN